MSRIVTLTTDWGQSDYYIGNVKASILSRAPETIFVDITHNIESFLVAQAAFVLKSAYKKFPAGTIHIVGVDSEPDKNGQILIIKHCEQYFIVNDNGCAALIFDDEKPEIVVVETGFAFDGASFVELNVFCDIAVFILKNGDISQLGEHTNNYKTNPDLYPVPEVDTINGMVIYIDSYGNAVTNISKEYFHKHVNGSKFEILINSNRYKSKTISKGYKEVGKVEIVTLFNSLDLLEIAIREGNASQLLSLNRKSEIRIKYNLK